MQAISTLWTSLRISVWHDASFSLEKCLTGIQPRFYNEVRPGLRRQEDRADMRIRSTHALSGSPLRCSSRSHRSAPSPSDDRPQEGAAVSSLAVSFPNGVAVALLLGTLAAVPLPAEAQSLYSIARDDDLLRDIDPVDGATIGIPIGITFPANTVSGGNGLATDPLTGDLYALVRIQEGFPPDRWLVTIDPATGVATPVGNTGEKFAGLAFDSGGTLYAVTGDGAVIPETLYTLSLIDATPTFVTSLGNGGLGETIGFNPADGFLYHASGFHDGVGGPDTRIFEKIDLDTLVPTNIPISGDGYSEMTALVFSGSSFFGADTDAGPEGEVFLSITDAGVTSVLGSTDHVAKGLAFVPEPSSSLMLITGVGFLAGLGQRRRQRPR